MKKIFLLRHAKSSWKDSSLSDFDRPLNDRGKRDAPIMAERFLKRNIPVDLIISSSSQRTVATAKIFSDILHLNVPIRKNDELYEASSHDILNCIRQIEDHYQNVIFVCHNPGITNLANYLSKHFIENIPTTGIAGFSFEKNWKDLKEKSCSFLFFDYPKKSD
jgi:phosphohistidine phosphatase